MRTSPTVEITLMAVLIASAVLSGCGAPDDQTEKVSGDLLQNRAYLSSGQPFKAKDGTDPGATMFNGAAYLAFIRTDGKIGVIVETNLSNNGGQSTSSYALTDATNYGPALIPYNGYLYLFYGSLNGQLYMRRSLDGVSWQGPWSLTSNSNAPSVFRPAPVVLNGQLIVYTVIANCGTFTCPNSDYFIFQYNINSDGISASGPYSEGGIYEQTGHTPAGTVWNNNLYLSWAGTDDSSPIYIKHYSLATGVWSSDTIISGNWGSPSLFPLSPSQMELVYRGNNAHIYRIYTTDGVTFSPPIEDNASTTNHSPAPFLASGSDVWTFYVGQSDELYTALE
jgi:hypothetical protein